MSQITANGQPIAANVPCTLEEILVAKRLLPRSVAEDNDDLPPR